MPNLTIGDKSVTVGDEFLKLSPEQQNAAVEEIAKSLGPVAAEPVTVNKVVRAAAEGVPLVGGVLNKLDAATNATLAPAVEPFLAPSANDISRSGPSTERIGDVQLPAKAPSWAQRYARSLEMQNKGDASFAAAHPYIDTAAKVAGGVAGTIPAMMAAPAAFGLTGSLGQMAARGAASNAALGGADALIRGEDPTTAMAVGGAVGAGAPLVGRAVGKLWQGIREARNPTAPVAQNVERVGGVDVPLTTGQATADPAVQAEEEIMRRGARGTSAEAIAKQADDEAQRAVAEASGSISRSLDPRSQPMPKSVPPANVPQEIIDTAHSDFAGASNPAAVMRGMVPQIEHHFGPDAAAAYTKEFQALIDHAAAASGASPRTAPQAAGQVVQSELAAQEAARQAAQAAQLSTVGAEGESLARGLGGGAAPASPLDAAEKVGAAVAARRAASVERTKAAYKARDEVSGQFDPSVPKGLAEDIRARLNTGDEPIWVDPTNESTANKALKLIDQTVGKDTGLFENAVVPKPAEARAAVGLPEKATEDETVAALRAKFGDSVADAYKKQTAAAPPPLSLLEFIASKGGLKPDPELDAIGLTHGHRSQIPGQSGFFGTVRKNGSEIDRMREAAQEAGYFHDSHGGTSTPTEFLDAIDAELRGQKKYPAGFEGFKGKRQVVAAGEREQAALAQIHHGFERDLEDAGHGALGSDMKQRAVALMHDEGLSADDAVEQAFRHLEQEDAAAAHGGFPGDKAAAAAVPKPVDLRTMDEARKRLVTMYGDAKSKALTTGDKSDLRAMGRILHEFDNSISDALSSGKFSGDAKLAKELQDAARASHAEYRQTFSSRGPGDEIGRAVEKILGRYSDTAATPEQIQALSYGPKSNPGTGNAVKVAGRLQKILSPEEYGQWKSGLFKYVDDHELSIGKRAARIDNFLKTSLAKGALTADDRSAMAAYSRNLRAAEPAGRPANDLEKAIARIAGTDGHLPASPGEVTDMLYSRTGKGDKGISQRLAVHLKQNLTPESWTAVRQGMWEKLTSAGEGKIPFEAQALSQRLHEFLNESGKGLSSILFTPAERAEMAKLAAVYRKMTPMKGTTNPSGSATIGAKIASKALNNLGAMLGFGAHGITGAIIGHGVQKAAGALKDAKAGKEAVRLFFGPQARRAAATSRIPALIAPSAVAASQR